MILIPDFNALSKAYYAAQAAQAVAAMQLLQTQIAAIQAAAALNTLTGTSGDDTWVNPGTKIILEPANGGIDTVLSDTSYSLADVANVENLTLTGTGNIDGTGNALDNVITGNAG